MSKCLQFIQYQIYIHKSGSQDSRAVAVNLFGPVFQYLSGNCLLVSHVQLEN